MSHIKIRPDKNGSVVVCCDDGGDDCIHIDVSSGHSEDGPGNVGDVGEPKPIPGGVAYLRPKTWIMRAAKGVSQSEQLTEHIQTLQRALGSPTDIVLVLPKGTPVRVKALAAIANQLEGSMHVQFSDED